MKPYYDDGKGIVIYHGDCRDLVASIDTVDLLIADPPYGINWKSGRGAHEILVADDGSLRVDSWLGPVVRKVRRGRHLYIFGLDEREIGEAPICGMTELIWSKGVMGLGDIESPWGPSHETILFGVQEISKANRSKNYGMTAARLRKGSVIEVQRPHSGQTLRHPTEKPLGLLRILIESSSTFGELVFDPFAGSGSTLEAARLEGRRAVGVEIDERYCEVAAKRLEQGLLQML